MPTRAEVTDVANAVFEEADAIMLSGETTVGKYPLKCIEVFDRIAKRIERSGSAQFHDAAELTTAAPKTREERRGDGQRTEGRRDSVLHAARPHGAVTPPGCARAIRRCYALCDNDKTAQRTHLELGRHAVSSWNLISSIRRTPLKTALKSLAEQGRLQPGETVVIIGAISVGTEIVDAVQMRTV